MIPSALAQATLASRFGPIEIAATERGIVAVALRTTPAVVAAEVARRMQREPQPGTSGADTAATGADRWLDEARGQLIDYLGGRRTAFDLPLDLCGLSPWDRRVLGGVREIDHGRTLGYGQLARRIGSPGAARAAGGAVSRNPLALVIPCHRVIAGDGTLGGYGGAWPADRDELLDLKVALLAHEGVHAERSNRAA